MAIDNFNRYFTNKPIRLLFLSDTFVFIFTFTKRRFSLKEFSLFFAYKLKTQQAIKSGYNKKKREKEAKNLSGFKNYSSICIHMEKYQVCFSLFNFVFQFSSASFNRMWVCGSETTTEKILVQRATTNHMKIISHKWFICRNFGVWNNECDCEQFVVCIVLPRLMRRKAGKEKKSEMIWWNAAIECFWLWCLVQSNMHSFSKQMMNFWRFWWCSRSRINCKLNSF